MSGTSLKAGSPRPVDERQPLLESRIPNARSKALVDPEAATQIDQPEAESVVRKVSVRKVFWCIIFVSLAGILFARVAKDFIKNDYVEFDFKKALWLALGGGLSGAAAMLLQVLVLMPLRTTMNYQYRHGGATMDVIETLYADGGCPRFYKGLFWALIQGPLSRFGDTAANAGIFALLGSNTHMKKLPPAIKTVISSLCAAGFRIILAPVDTIKTTLQTEGESGQELLRRRVREYGITSLWFGALAGAVASFAAHYPWFTTYNYLQELLPKQDPRGLELSRQAFIGFCASLISDTISNSLRVVKVYRQTHKRDVGYVTAVREIVAEDGWIGLFGRGLKTRIIASGFQGIMFSVLWKMFSDLWDEKMNS